MIIMNESIPYSDYEMLNGLQGFVAVSVCLGNPSDSIIFIIDISNSFLSKTTWNKSISSNEGFLRMTIHLLVYPFITMHYRYQ